MNDNQDDFWGKDADWLASSEGDHTGKLPRTDDTGQVDASGPVARTVLGGSAAATRSHGVSQTPSPTTASGAGASVRARNARRSADDGWDDGWDVEPALVTASGVSPTLAKIGGIVVVLTLLLPIVLSLSSGSDDDLIEAAATVESSRLGSAADDVELPASGTSELSTASESDDHPDATTATTIPLPVPVTAPSETAKATSNTASAQTTAGAAAAKSTSSNSSATTAASDDEAADDEAADDEAADDEAADDEDSAASVSTSSSSSASSSSSTSKNVSVSAIKPATCAVNYKVVNGDFWFGIANRSGVSVSNLLSANNASQATWLYPGDTICLPAGSQTPSPATTQPANTQPTNTQPANTQPATTHPPTTQPATTQPATTQPANTQPATTHPPHTTQPPATTAPSNGGSSTPTGSVEQIIRAVWPDELEERALQIAWRESNYVPTAENYCCVGLFQIYWDVHKSWLAGIGITSKSQLYDPATNARAAYGLYQRAGGWGPWSL